MRYPPCSRGCSRSFATSALSAVSALRDEPAEANGVRHLAEAEERERVPGKLRGNILEVEEAGLYDVLRLLPLLFCFLSTTRHRGKCV